MERDYFTLKKPNERSGFVPSPTFLQFCAIVSGAYDYEKNEIKKGDFFDYPNLFVLNCAKELKLLHLPYLWECIGAVKKTMLDFGLVAGIDYDLNYLCGSSERIVVNILQNRDTIPTNKSLCFGSFEFYLQDLNDVIDNYPYFN